MNRTRFTLIILLVSAVVLHTGLAGASMYHIDSQGGDDRNDGRFETTPWKSHTMAQKTPLRPGDVVMFKRGSQFSGPLHISESGTPKQPITLTAYGKGKAPRFTNPSDRNMNGNCIRLSGSHLIVEKLHFHDTPPTRNSSRLKSIFQMGAVFNMLDAKHNIIRNNTFTKCTKGIQSTGEFTLITKNKLDGPSHPLWTMPGAKGAWGPMGVQLGIGNQEVSYNTIKNYLTLNSPYGSDGGAIELDDGRYHKRNVYIHHNYTEGNAGFFESSWEADHNPKVQKVYNLRVAFNVSYDGQSFVYMHAPCIDTVFDNNTVIRTNGFGSPMYDIVYTAFPGILFRNNLYVGTAKSFRGGPYKKKERVVARNNWFWNVDSAQSDGDPKLLDMQGKNFRLRGDSPLQRKALNLSKYYTTDFAGNPLPETGPWDIGAFSYGGSLPSKTSCTLP
jgi:hypothetical protein